MASTAEDVVGATMASLQSIAAPEVLKSSIERHQENLMTLAFSLLDGGQSEAFVRQALDDVFASYKSELLRAIVTLGDRS